MSCYVVGLLFPGTCMQSTTPPLSMAPKEVNLVREIALQYNSNLVDHFNALTPQERIFIYYLYRASLAGNLIAADQSHRDTLIIRNLLEHILEHKDQLLKREVPFDMVQFVKEVEIYLTYFWTNHSAYFMREHADEKRTPKRIGLDVLTQENLMSALTALNYPEAQNSVSAIAASLFDRQNESTQTVPDSIVKSAVNFYSPDFTDEDFKAIDAKGQRAVNAYFYIDEKEGKRIPSYQLYSVNGKYAQELSVAVYWLQKAHDLAQKYPQQFDAHFVKSLAYLIDYFDEVIIAVDTPDTAGAATGSEEEGGETSREAAFYGGNTLIIACRNDDWKRIETLIEKLDQPSPQVLIEVLITDLTLDDSRALGTALRNPEKIPLAGNTAYQSAHLAPGVMPESFDQTTIPNTIGLIEDKSGNVQAATDLLRTFDVDADTGVRSDGTETDIADQLADGSTVISWNDNSGKTWGITQILKLLDHSKILSHPHVISTSDKKAIIEISETRLLQDAATGSQGGTVVATRKNIEAKLLVEITPRISISETKENAVNLQIKIDINQFRSTTDNTRITRNVTTNVTVNSGDILALGGLIRSNEQDGETNTPILSQIPLIGWMFKKRLKTEQRTNLTVFISPTVILPREREGLTEYTKDYLGIARAWAKEGSMFDSLKDPITRWFFTSESPTERFTKGFLQSDIRFQTTPMPQAPIGPMKQPKYTQVAENSPQYSAQPDTTVIAQQEQHEQLKELFKEIDDPFKTLHVDALAQNEPPPAIAPQQTRPSRRKRRR